MRGATILDHLARCEPAARYGRVRRIMPTFIEADGPDAPLGSLCWIEDSRDRRIAAEVVRVECDRISLVPLSHGAQYALGDRVVADLEPADIVVGTALQERAIDGLGQPIDGGPPIRSATRRVLQGSPLPPLALVPIDTPLVTGIRAVDSLLTIGRGQRVGIFAASGGGKTTLMAQLVRNAQVDAVVMCLVGERGREVGKLWREALDDTARCRSSCFVATSDDPAPLRVRTVWHAVAQANYWREQGLHVLLVIDSMTRFAMALREVGLAAGEPPSVRAYTPNVFATLPRIVEQCGALGAGAVTAVMTVLSDSDDVDDPISELMRSLLDGHIILTRSLAERGHFPAIDITRSISRVAHELKPSDEMAAAARVRGWLAALDASRMLRDAGLYQPGGDQALDKALDRQAAIEAFLKQSLGERSDANATRQALLSLAGI